MSTYPTSDRLIRLPELIGDRKLGLPGIIPFRKTKLWDMVRQGSFPKPVKVSSRVTAWRLTDVEQYLKDPASYRQEVKSGNSSC